MCCQCNYKSNIRTDCIHYHCEHDMGASIDCCTLKGLGNCPCTKDCSDYVDKAEVYRLGLEALKQPKIIHCNECVYGEQDEEERWKSRSDVTMRYVCGACGEPVDNKDNYCRNCGRRLVHGRSDQ